MTKLDPDLVGVCSNCQQWQHASTKDCLNECVRRGFAKPPIWDVVIDARGDFEPKAAPTPGEAPVMQIRRTKPTLEEAQAFVGGLVQLVEVRVRLGRDAAPQNAQILIDEEGLLKGYFLNPTASRIAGCPIVGPALLLIGDAQW